MTTTRLCRVTQYTIEIKTQPHNDWEMPGGWGPYYTAREAEEARVEADKHWMRARVSKSVSDAQLTDDQIRNFRALGQPVAVL